MLFTPALKDYIVLATSNSRIAITVEIDTNDLTPLAAFSALAIMAPETVMMESSENSVINSEFSYIALQPMAYLIAQKGLIYKTINGLTTLHHEQPLAVLRELHAQLNCYVDAQYASTVSSSIGFLSYDAVRYFETIPDSHAHDDIPEVLFTFYRTTLTFNHKTKKIILSIIDDSTEKSAATYQKITAELLAVIDKITAINGVTATAITENYQPTTQTDLSDEEFMQIVEKAKIAIKKGDAFQIVLSRRFFQTYTASPLTIYKTLKKISPAPYMFYIPYKEHVILGASPERLIAVENGKISINPIAGTRRRDPETKLDDITQELLNDNKEIAEHMMLVDLARNDIGAVCKPGSIEVKELLKVKHYSHISHITSLVTGELHADFDAYDALAYAFPAGTLSGAPKIRAMEIIDELETSRRGLYGGAICRFDYQGNLNSCIAIRMAVLKDGIACIRTGAGIVFDSEPVNEAEETRNKARNVLEAIRLAHTADAGIK